MKFLVQLPFDAVRNHDEWCAGGHLRDWARAVEDAGLDAVAVTDHPFPSDAWLAAGGHHAFDPFVALAVFGEATTRLRLITDIVVATYRNPYLVAKSIASLDVLSGGRLIVGLAAGYQEAEFNAVGGHFADRGPRFDEGLDAMRDAWTGESVQRTAGFYPASGHTMLPAPAQRPGPPIWIGGNSGPARRRAVERADGWMPFPQPIARAGVTGSSTLGSVAELAERVAEVQAARAELGVAPLTICSPSFGAPDDPAAYAAAIPAYEAAGVHWLSVPAGGSSMQESIGRIRALGEALRPSSPNPHSSTT